MEESIEVPEVQPPELVPSHTKTRKVYAAAHEDFHYDHEQPVHSGQASITKSWVVWKTPPKIKFDRSGPFQGARKARKAELEAMVASGVELPPKQKKQNFKVEGGSSRMGCALNNYLNCAQNRTGMCNFYKDYLGWQQGVMNVKAPVNVWHDLCMHEECYYTYHEVWEGVVLNLASKINEVRRSHKTLKKWNRKTCWHRPRRVQQDIHHGEELPGNHSQDD